MQLPLKARRKRLDRASQKVAASLERLARYCAAESGADETAAAEAENDKKIGGKLPKLYLTACPGRIHKVLYGTTEMTKADLVEKVAKEAEDD